ncbi:hypothetical protein KO561_19680 [Radiobacillus kanasensis]|uniref:hypothetical protein n=1 Tax=Radiobacillus kanasensis TaxID=2844358 RepID=UPI001E4B7F2C|nr:hypothetical protein [Radiobacillus kanasensis]UFT99360.1 hypothetical protein KO561_19680 [Radiobacillus kanasensis]
MKKIFITLSLTISFILGGCTSNIQPILKGTYQSDAVNGYVVQIAFQPDENSFVEYIDNREVDSGAYEKYQENVYKLESNKQNFKITLNEENAFEVIIDTLNNGKPIKLNNIRDIPVYSSTEFDDVDTYKALLNKN